MAPASLFADVDGASASRCVELGVAIRRLDAPLDGLDQLSEILPSRELDPHLVASKRRRSEVEDGIAGALAEERDPRWIWYRAQQHDGYERAAWVLLEAESTQCDRSHSPSAPSDRRANGMKG